MKNFFRHYCLPVFLIVASLTSSGCSRFQTPNSKLDFNVYSPKGTTLSEGQYVIGVRDELEVLVWRCPELDTTAVVRPEDGKISVPLVGDVKAAGETPKSLAEAISKLMAMYVKEPRIAVGVKKFGDKKVFILGQVVAQGAYRLEKEDRLIDLISKAGGFTDSAVPSCTYIIRGGYDNPKIIRANIGRLLRQGDTSQNVYVTEGDIIFVPMTELENLNYALRKVFPSLFFAEKMNDLKQNIMTGGYDWHDLWLKAQGRE